jgi:putative transcriptional regulator
LSFCQLLFTLVSGLTNKPNKMTLQNNLKTLRFNKNQITQEELAVQVNVSRQTIHAIENGKFNPSVRLALTIAAFFACRVEDVFYLKKEEEQNE